MLDKDTVVLAGDDADVDQAFEVRSEPYTFVTPKFSSRPNRASGEGESSESSESDGGETAESESGGESDGESTGETDD